MSLLERMDKARRERAAGPSDEFKSGKGKDAPRSPFARRVREGKLPVRVELHGGPNPLDPPSDDK